MFPQNTWQSTASEQSLGVVSHLAVCSRVRRYADYANRYQVGGFPTFLLFEDGSPVGMHQASSVSELQSRSRGALCALRARQSLSSAE